MSRARDSQTPTAVEALLLELDSTKLAPDTGLVLPWLPQPNETAQEYLCFSVWLEQVDIRGNAPRTPLAKRWQWYERAKAYDAHMAANPAPTPKESADSIAKSLLGTMQLTSHLVRNELQKHLIQGIQSGVPMTDLPALVKIVETLGKTARLLTDQTTETIGVGRFDLKNLSSEEFETLQNTVAKALPG